MSLYVIRDRESGAFYTGDTDDHGGAFTFDHELTAGVELFDDPDDARDLAEHTLPEAADVLELRPWTGAVEWEYARYKHMALSHNMLGRDYRDCDAGSCRALRRRLGLERPAASSPSPFLEDAS